MLKYSLVENSLTAAHDYTALPFNVITYSLADVVQRIVSVAASGHGSVCRR